MIFVSGGTGLLGAHLLYKLVANGEKVRALKRETSNTQEVLKIFSYYSADAQKYFDAIEWVNGDMLDYFSLEKALAGVHEIYHCAAIVSFDPKERESMISNNVEGTANMVNAAIENGVKKICHVSSIAALGKLPGDEPVSEETNWVPGKKHSAYSESKFYSETEIWRGIEEGLDAVIVNPSIIIGPGYWENSSSRLFKTIWNGLKFYTKGVSGYVDVNDVVEVMTRLMQPDCFESHKNQRFLLNAENRSYKDVFFEIADALDKPRPSVFASNFLSGLAWRTLAVWGWISRTTPAITRDIATGKNEVTRYDGSKVTEKLGFQYAPLSESLKRTARLLKAEMNAR